MRKVPAWICVMFVMAATFTVVALPAGAQSGYPPATTTTTTKPPPPTSTPPTTSVTPTTSVIPTTPTTQVTPTTPTSQAAGQAAAARLAFTGSDSQPLLILGIVAVTLGGVIFVATRRRSSVRANKP